MKPDMRYPNTIEAAIADVLEALTDPTVQVGISKELMLEMLTLLAKIKHS